MQRMWLFGRKGPSGFSGRSTAEEVTQGIDGSRLTAIVTGASSGLGVETTRVLALRGVHVVMGVRNLDAGRNVKQAIIKETPAALIDIMELELSSLASVRKFASEYTSSGLPLNILINNAGTMATSFMLSEDGIEVDFATNYLGHFLLTNLLLEIMKTTARESKTEGRIVNVSSMSHQITYSEGIRFNEINSQAGYRSLYAYGQSKLANILHANELARSLKEEGVNITANSVHPGTIPTGLTRHLGLIGVFGNMVIRYVFKNVQQGAATTCYVALSPQVKRLTGQYFIDSNLAEPSFQAKDSEMAKKLWNLSIDMTNTK